MKIYLPFSEGNKQQKLRNNMVKYSMNSILPNDFFQKYYYWALRVPSHALSRLYKLKINK